MASQETKCIGLTFPELLNSPESTYLHKSIRLSQLVTLTHDLPVKSIQLIDEIIRKELGEWTVNGKKTGRSTQEILEVKKLEYHHTIFRFLCTEELEKKIKDALETFRKIDHQALNDRLLEAFSGIEAFF